MRDSDWRAWLNSLPPDSPSLQELHTGLARQLVAAEARLSAALWQGDAPGQRSIRIELNELNCQLLLLERRLQEG
ncbi:hypothetical protein E7T06_13955 [Deinococcus sp. Arct2-2]|nr:hypothetical protein E7T06_13955 [Deinococcus sp. Arct2-2]